MAKLNKVDYEDYKNNMLHRMFTFNIPFEKVSRYIDEDLDDVKQAKRMKSELDCEYAAKKQAELDDLLSDILDVLQQPEKWAIDNAGKLVNIYPHPVIKDRKVVGVEYKTNKSYLFEDEELYNRYVFLDIMKNRKRHPNREYPKELLEEWLKLHKGGLSYSAIGRRYDIHSASVSYQIKKYKKGLL